VYRQVMRRSEYKRKVQNLTLKHEDALNQLAISCGSSDGVEAPNGITASGVEVPTCSRRSPKIYNANPALVGFGNGFMRIIGANQRCDGMWTPE